jgi:glycogen debranching enzyme
MVSDSLGDVPLGSVGGLLHEDTRFLSRWELTLGGRELSLLKSGEVDYDSAVFFLTNPDLPGLGANSVAVKRLRLVGDGAFEQISVFNTRSEPVEVELRLACGADFADLFEVRDVVRDRSASIVNGGGIGGHSLRFRYQVPGFLAETTIRVERSDVLAATTRSATTRGPSGRTTTRSSRSVWRAPGSATWRIASRSRSWRRPRSPASACPRCSPGSSAASAAFRSRTRPRAARRPGRPARRSSSCR